MTETSWAFAGWPPEGKLAKRGPPRGTKKKKACGATTSGIKKIRSHVSAPAEGHQKKRLAELQTETTTLLIKNFDFPGLPKINQAATLVLESL